MDSHEVSTVLTVRIGHHSSQLGNDVRRPARVGTQVHPLLIIIIGVFVVPDDWRSLEHCGDLLQRLERDVLWDDLVPCPHDVNVRSQLSSEC